MQQLIYFFCRLLRLSRPHTFLSMFLFNRFINRVFVVGPRAGWLVGILKYRCLKNKPLINIHLKEKLKLNYCKLICCLAIISWPTENLSMFHFIQEITFLTTFLTINNIFLQEITFLIMYTNYISCIPKKNFHLTMQYKC